jgi:plasmid stability protein
MTVTINLPQATEDRLRARAAATGKDMDTLVVEAVDASLAISELNLRTILAPVHEDFRTSGMTELELDEILNEALMESRADRKGGRPTSL